MFALRPPDDRGIEKIAFGRFDIDSFNIKMQAMAFLLFFLMGISQVEIDATEVIIKTAEKEIVITNPQVSKVNMMGQETFQVVGDFEERPISSEPEINDEDIKMKISNDETRSHQHSDDLIFQEMENWNSNTDYINFKRYY